MANWLRRTAALAVGPMVLLAQGCVRFEPRPLLPTQTVRNLESRTLTDIGLKAFIEKNTVDATKEWPRRSWNFTSLTLAGWYYHPSLDVARAQWGVAQAETITAGAWPNPTVSIAPEYSFNPQSGVSPWIAGLNFDIPIETAGKRGYRVAKAKHLSEAARLNIGSVAWQVRSNLRSNLNLFATASRRTGVLTNQQAIQEEIVKLLERRLQAGAIAPFELTTARITLTKTQLELRNAQSLLAASRTGVAEAIGLTAEALADVEFDYDLENFEAKEFTVSEIRRQALQNRTDIIAALAEYAASQSALQLEVAKQYPDVHLGSGYQYDQGQDKWALGLSVELPVLNQNQGGIAEAKARRVEAAARFTELQAKIISEIDRAVTQQAVSLEQLRSATNLISAQQKQFGSIESQFRVGEIDRLELVTAKLELATAEIIRLEALIKAQESLNALEDAVRRPFDSEDWKMIEQPQSPPIWNEKRETKN